MSSIKEDIEEFVGMPYEELVKNVEPEKAAKENAWDYFASEEYAKLLFYEAMQKQNEPAMPQALANLIESYFTQPRILDYGCGTGMRALAIYAMNCRDITLADVPSRYYDFLKFINEKYKIDLKFLSIEELNEYPLESNYDIIVFSDFRSDFVLTLLHLVEHLEMLGHIYLNFPGFKVSTIEDMGLKRKYKGKEGWTIFQKVPEGMSV